MSLVDLGKRLLEAAKQGDTEEVRQLMTNGAPFTTDWLGTSPLHIAAQFGFLETAEVLLRAGISRDARTKVDRTPLHIAAQEGHLEIVELLLKHGADVEAKDMLKMTSLHWAVERGHHEVIATLLKYGANATAVSKFYKTPSDIAIDNCRHDLIEYLNENSLDQQALPALEENFHSKQQQIAFAPTTVSNTHRSPLILKSAHRNINNATAAQRNVKNAPKLTTLKPIILNAQKSEKILASSDEIDSDSNSTSVLATLAALAEASASNTTMSSSDTLQWLESHGITMLPNDNSTIVTSAVESGQTISLTEAGKLALNWVKNNNAQKSNEKRTIVTTQGSVPIMQKVANSRVIQIVADASQLPLVQSSQLISTKPMVQLKKVVTVVDNEENEREQLKNELEAMRKQAEEYKNALHMKEHEAEQYKKQLEEMQATSTGPTSEPKSKS